jgi:Tol biopolymer transport system component
MSSIGISFNDSQMKMKRVSQSVKVIGILLAIAAFYPGQLNASADETSVSETLWNLAKSLAKTHSTNEIKLEVKEISLGHVPEELSLDDITISPNQRRVAFAVRQGGKFVVVVDGKEIQTYDEVLSRPRFSPDSQRVAYVARREGLQFMVVDGIEGKGYDPWPDMYPIFSPDSKRIAYMARRRNSTMMVIDEVEGKPYRSLNSQEFPKFSPNSKRFAYSAERSDKKWVVVVDGQEGKSYDSVKDPQFSPDSKHVLYEAKRQHYSFVVCDGVEGPAFKGISLYSSSFSPDSQRVAYLAGLDNFNTVMVIDGERGKEYEYIQFWHIIFSPNSIHTVYTAQIGTQQCVVLDNKEGPFWDRIEWFPRFSPDGNRMAYVGMRDWGSYMVVDNMEGLRYNYIGEPVFSPNSKHIAYAASRGLTWTVVCDGQEGLSHILGMTDRTEIVFSPDSQRMAYQVPGKLESVVIDGVQSKHYGLIGWGSLIFSPDSKHVAYWATPLFGLKWSVVIDGLSSSEYEKPFYRSKLIFDTANSLHALALQDGEILLVEITILSP